MEQYLNLGGNSNVKAYSIGQDYIDVVFGRGARYRYSYRSAGIDKVCLLYTSPSPRDMRRYRMPSSA